MGSLHFISNNILTKFFKELKKYKDDYQYYLNYIYRNYIMHLILSIFMHGINKASNCEEINYKLIISVISA